MNAITAIPQTATPGAAASWTAAATEARRRFCVRLEESAPNESVVPAAHCRRTPKTRSASAHKNARGLPHPKTWWRITSAGLAVATISAGIVSSVLAADFPRTSDHDYDAPAPGTYSLPVVKTAADGDVLDSDGRALRLRELTRGRVTVLSFIYTRCAAARACPYATGVLNQLHRFTEEEPSLARKMRFISMSFDPANDTPERMMSYSALARGRTNAAEWRFLTTRSQTELRPILDAYEQAVDRKKNPDDPTGPLNHTLRVFLIDRAGNIRNIYNSDTLDTRLVLADVRTLLLEKASAVPRQLSGAH